MEKSITLVVVLTLSGLLGWGLTHLPDRTTRYYVTNQGLTVASSYYCSLGMLLNHDRDNVYGVDEKPITCTGYLDLTKTQRASY